MIWRRSGITRRLGWAWLLVVLTLLAPLPAAAAAMVPAAVAVQLASEPTTYELWLAALAILTTIASAVVLAIPQHWNEWAKRGVVAVIAGVISLGGTFYGGQLDTDDWGRTWLVVFLGATSIYVIIVKPLSAAVKRAT